jgi:hypothetical protein
MCIYKPFGPFLVLLRSVGTMHGRTVAIQSTLSPSKRGVTHPALQGQGNGANKLAIGRAGGVDAVLSAMRCHADVVGVQEHGCGAQLSLAAGSCDANQTAIARAGGLDVVLTALQRHADAVGMQLEGCGALESLAAARASDSTSCCQRCASTPTPRACNSRRSVRSATSYSTTCAARRSCAAAASTRRCRRCIATPTTPVCSTTATASCRCSRIAPS